MAAFHLPTVLKCLVDVIQLRELPAGKDGHPDTVIDVEASVHGVHAFLKVLDRGLPAVADATYPEHRLTRFVALTHRQFVPHVVLLLRWCPAQPVEHRCGELSIIPTTADKHRSCNTELSLTAFTTFTLQ